jgi:N-hydroxyarylamine O-acetyltransferase
VSDFDLPAYLRRIGYDGDASVDAATLGAVANHHARAIAFENLDPYRGVVPGLDDASLVAKLVEGRRGGWCFEQNRLLQLALEAMGFRTTGLAARVVWMRPPDAPPNSRTHMLLLVDLDEGPHLVDVGFGGCTLTGALRFEPGVEQETPHEPFRISDLGAGLHALQIRLGGDWVTEYEFDLQPQIHADYEMGNWYLSTNPASSFLQAPVGARPTDGTRFSFRAGTLMTYVRGAPPAQRALTSVDEVRQLYGDLFGIDVPDDAELDVKLAALLPTATTSS